METTTTEGIKISVETVYQSEYSRLDEEKFVFAYQVTIENQNDFSVQLLSRHWYIFDSIGMRREVEGEGVIGKQPIIAPGSSHRYVSGTSIQSEMGRMHGTYTMVRLPENKKFEVIIPAFNLIVPFKMN